MKKKILSIMIAICMFSGVLPVTTYAGKTTAVADKQESNKVQSAMEAGLEAVKLSTLITDGTVDEQAIWEAGAELAVGTVLQNDTSFELEIFYAASSVTGFPTGANPEIIAAGAEKAIVASGGGITTAGGWKLCGNRKGGNTGSGTEIVKYAIVLYPSAVAEYTVIFDANGHGSAPAAVTKLQAGSKITEPAALSATGYTFEGWYKEAGCVNVWDFSKDTVSGNITLYAKWKEIPATVPGIKEITPAGAVYGYGDGVAKVTVFPATVSGYTYTYQWYRNEKNTNSGGTEITGAVSAVYTLPAGMNAGDYYYYCVVTASGNGQNTVFTSEAATVKIEKKELEITWSNTELTYTGSAQAPTATATGLVGTDSCTIQVSGAQTNATGEGIVYTATAENIAGNTNYKLPASCSTTFVIKPAKMTVTAQDVSYKHSSTTGYGITVNVTNPTSGYMIKYGEKEGVYDLTASPLYKTVGSKTVYFQVTDNNHNYETYTGSAVVTIVDATAPTGSIYVDDKTYTGFVSSITFSSYLTSPQEVEIECEDDGSGPGEIYYYLSQTALTSTQVQSKDLKWKLYKDTFELKKDNKYIVYAKLLDEAGNMRYISTNGLVIDGTDPAISGVKDGGEYCQSVTVTVSDTNLDTVYLDTAKKTVSSGKATFSLTGDGKEHTITATDKAGNEVEYTVTTNSTHTFSDFEQVQTEGEWSLEESVCENGCGTKYKRYRKNSEIIAEEDPSGGSIATNVEVRTGAPATGIVGLDTALAKSLVTNASSEVSKGVDVLVYLDVTKPSSVTSTDKTSTENAIRQYSVQNLKEGMYLDLSLYQKKGSSTATKISKNGLGKNLKISLTLPETLKAPAGTVRTYYIVRVHSGTATVLNTTLKDNVITFETDRFSTYSIWYTESGTSVSANSAASNQMVSGTANGTTAADGTATGDKDSVPKTGDEDLSLWYGLLCLIGAVGTVYYGWKKILKKRNGE